VSLMAAPAVAARGASGGGGGEETRALLFDSFFWPLCILFGYLYDHALMLISMRLMIKNLCERYLLGHVARL
jgi:hypothetical protein